MTEIPSARPLVVVDVGCRWGFHARWSALGVQARLIGFDADPAECARLREGAPENVSYVAAALGARPGPARLHLTRKPACSSLYAPDLELIAERPELDCTFPMAEVDIELTTLDLWLAGSTVEAVDILKLDTQGSELDILRGAEHLLTSVRAVEVEVEFNPIYRDQPLFGDVDRHLRARGFVLWRLSDLVHYGLPGSAAAAPTAEFQIFDATRSEFPGRCGQVFWAQAFYVRREMAQGRDPRTAEEARRDALIAGAFGFMDLASRAAERAAAAG